MKGGFIGCREQGEQASEAAAEMVDREEEQGKKHSSVRMDSTIAERIQERS